MSFKKSKAIFKKQILDTMKNSGVLVQFIIFPVFGFIMTKTIASGSIELPHTYFVTMFSSMFVGMSPAMAMQGIISEEKEKGSLKSLLMANVKPHEYLVGVGGYTLVMCLIGVGIFAFAGEYSSFELIKYFLIMLFGILCSMMLGASVGIVSKNQIVSSSIILPITMVISFLPTISIFNDGFRKMSKFLYTQQVYDIINNLDLLNVSFESIVILIVNFILFLFVFVNFYHKKGLMEN